MPRPFAALAGFAVAALLGAPARAEPSFEARAEEMLRRASEEQLPSERYRLAEEAIALGALAARAAPADPLPHLTIARALSIHDPQHPELCRADSCQRAVEEFTRARTLDVEGLETETIASELGLLFSRVGRYADALAEYDRALKSVENGRLLLTERIFAEVLGMRFSPSSHAGHAILIGNSAETLMALGRLQEATARYQAARDASEPGGIQWRLSHWGLGLALDRDDQGEAARAAIRAAMTNDPTMGQLSQDNVFFEPPGDKFCYLALGHEVAGDHAQAIAAWRAYLASSTEPRYARRARAHLEALRATARPVDFSRMTVSMGEPQVVSGTRSTASLKETLRGYEGDVRLCYERALRADATAAGDLMLGLEIDASGYVSSMPRVFDSSHKDPSVARCIELAATNWRFSTVHTTAAEPLIVRIRLQPPRLR